MTVSECIMMSFQDKQLLFDIRPVKAGTHRCTVHPDRHTKPLIIDEAAVKGGKAARIPLTADER